MRFKKWIGAVLAAMGLALFAEASPCGESGRLCAPAPANTSGRSAAPSRVALLLPLESSTLGPAAEALRLGFMAAWERDRGGVEVDLIDSGETTQAVLDAYAAAVVSHDIVVGPLARSAVAAVASSPVVNKPTLALNYPTGGLDTPLPEQMLVIGLSIEDEARQAAQLVARAHPGAKVFVVGTAQAWQRRIAAAFANESKQQGLEAQVLELPATNGHLGDAALELLKARIDTEAPKLLFAALDPPQARQLRHRIGPALPLYGASSVNPGREPGAALPELDGMRLLDLPWLVQSDHPAVMSYPRLSARGSLDMDRLYALGIDAFRLAHALTRSDARRFELDGVSGMLAVRFGAGLASFSRRLPQVIYRGGVFENPAPKP